MSLLVIFVLALVGSWLALLVIIALEQRHDCRETAQRLAILERRLEMLELPSHLSLVSRQRKEDPLENHN